MLKLTKTGIGLLAKQYRSVLRKCIWINSGICILLTLYSNVASGHNLCFDHSVWDAKMYANVVITPHNCDSLGDRYELVLNLNSVATKQWITSNYYTKSDIYNKSEVQNIQSLNYYYTFRDDKISEAAEFALFFQKDFSTLQEVDLQSKNPTHLGAFAKCSKVCPRLSELFASSLIQEQMFKNDASIDAGTSRHCLRQFGDVVADLLKNMASKYAKMNDFMNVEVCHA